MEGLTTRTHRRVDSPFDYLVWDNLPPSGKEEDRGAGVQRFTVRIPCRGGPRGWRGNPAT